MIKFSLAIRHIAIDDFYEMICENWSMLWHQFSHRPSRQVEFIPIMK